MNTQKQSGSAHVIIIGILVVALLGALGFVFYQNFMAKKTDTTSSSTETMPKEQLKTARVALNSAIYALDYPSDWSEVIVPGAGNTNSVTITNPDKSVRVKMDVSSGGIGGACDSSSPLKLRFYNVYPQAVTKLNASTAYVVEAMTDAEGGGYNYKIGLTQDGGDTHAALGDSMCTVSYVGVASRLVLQNDTVTSPTIILTIDFPKLVNGDDTRVKEMQVVKDMIATDDYKAAIKTLESARKE
ncbi:MAG TPA: hypothetical protein VFH06_03595 [Candidatus Saccharimonadales bacterium]|nr:hypothetical protein [Candidatus Saccharimonadales bacterium]